MTDTATTPITQILRMNAHYDALHRTENLRTYYHDPSRCQAMVDAICEIAVDKQIKAISCDVFDTALLRDGKSEAGRFQAMSEHFVNRCRETGNEVRFSTDDAFIARLYAARAAYSMSPTRAGNREGRFEDIARVACDLLGVPDMTTAYIANELACELAATIANPLVSMLREALPKTRMVFLSDMYLETGQIARLLAEKFGQQAAKNVYSSADGHGSKRAGTLFAHVEKLLHLPGEKILHIGDNLLTDYQIPKQCGWNAVYLPLPEGEKRSRRCCHEVLAERLAGHGIHLDDYLQFNL